MREQERLEVMRLNYRAAVLEYVRELARKWNAAYVIPEEGDIVFDINGYKVRLSPDNVVKIVEGGRK